MKKFYWRTVGNGKINIILLNGWGLDSKIWFFVIQKLNKIFTFHLIDLPGIGVNKHIFPIKINEINSLLYNNIKKKSIWMGWSIGGLIVNQFATSYPERVLGVINITSSPCFVKKKMAWNEKRKTISVL